MYEDILVATDGSDVASRAAAQGLRIAADLGAHVHVLSVADVGAGVEQESARGRAREECQGDVDAVADDAAAAGVPVVTSIRDGRPHQEILAYADEQDLDLVVVGTRGRTGLRRWLLGSVALGVVQHARRPVLTIGTKATRIPRRIERILVATNGRPGSDAAVDQAIGLAAAFDATLRAMYVVDDVHSRLPVVIEAFEQLGEESTAEIVARAREQDIDVDRTVERGIPSETITDYADEHEIDLIVMGAESHTGLERFAVGSVAQRVVGTSSAPVITIRPTE